MKKGFLSLALLFVFSISNSQITYFEQSGGTKTPRYQESVEYAHLLANTYPEVQYKSFGTSPQGRELPLLIVNKKGQFTPDQQPVDQMVILVQACIHAGESEGKDAGFMLIRDLLNGERKIELPDNVSLLFIPIFNVDGHEHFGPYNRINQNGPEEMGFRITAQGLNLNRDYMKAESPEMQDWLKLFNEWDPDFFIDCHTTDGADYQYVLTFSMETNGNMDPGLSKWQKEEYIPAMEKHMNKAGFPIFPYVNFRNWHDPRSGLRGGAAPPMISQGYTALLNRPGLLIETHMLKPYKQRVYSTYEMLLFAVDHLSKNAGDLKKRIVKADQKWRNGSQIGESIAIDYTTSKTDSIMVDFLGVDYDIVHSDLTGGNWFQYHPEKKVTFSLPYFNKVLPAVEVNLPKAYLIPAEWTEIIQKLDLHGIAYYHLASEQEMDVSEYRFSDVKWAKSSFEGRHQINDFKLSEAKAKKVYPAGTVVVPMNQNKARLAACLLEPKANNSLLSWGFFDVIFEQKEYAESYVMEKLAREMLKENPKLKVEFEAWKKDHPELAQNQWMQLNWFYQRSPYWDDRINLYPVARLMD